MFFELTHTTTYHFSRPVFLEPHTFRLRPRCDGSQRVCRFQVEIDPAPAGLSDCVDLEGNAVMHVWFEGLTPILRVTSVSEVETLRDNPFDYIIHDPPARRLPLVYAGEPAMLLAPYCSRQGGDDPVARFARDVAVEAGGETLPFLTAMAGRISRVCRVTAREVGEPRPPSETLSQGQGACRDLAVLFMDACRALGMGARFVSGYQEGDSGRENRDLHAWAEVYLPGGGWRGYDPTLGLAVADRHIAVAAGISPSGAAPITGAFRGTGVSSQLHHEIRLRASDGPFQ